MGRDKPPDNRHPPPLYSLKEWFAPAAFAVLVLLVALGATFAVWHSAKQNAQRELQINFDFRVRETIDRLEQRMVAYEQVLRGARGLFTASKQVSREEFRVYVESLHLEENYRGIQGVGFALLVPKAEKARHIEGMRRAGFPAYAIRPDGDRDPYTSIVQLEPFDWRNQRAFGYDMYSEPVRREAMAQARDTGKASLSGKVTLVQETNEQVQSGFLMYLPVYQNAKAYDTPVARQSSIAGWVYAPFRMGDLMAGLGGERTAELDVDVYDGLELLDDMRMYCSAQADGPHPVVVGGLVAVKRIDILGHPWALKITALPSFAMRIQDKSSQIIAFAGVNLSALLTLVTWLLATGRKRALALAAKMTGELRESQRVVQEGKQRLERMTATVPVVLYDYVVQADGAPSFIFVSQRCPELLELPTDRLLADMQAFWRLIHPDDIAILDSRPAGLGEGLGCLSGEFRIVTPSGKLKWLQASSSLNPVSDGEAKSGSGFFLDVSQRKLAENALTEKNQQLDAANRQLARATRMKDEFLANMSHELRTPLNAILGMTEAMLEQVLGPVAEQQAAALNTIQSSAGHLLELINDLLDLAKIEAGEVELELMPVSMQKICQASLLFVKQQAQKKSIRLEVNVPADLPSYVLDERRIRQVLINLLSNAVKFSPDGGRVILEVARLTQEATDPNTRPKEMVRVSVTDFGIGISEEDVGKLFKPFIQIDSALNRQYAGTGLGLALVRQIVELHGGTVNVSSAKGKGSRFTVELCCQVAASPARAGAELDESFAGLTDERLNQALILLAEDNEANVNTFSSYLKAKGYKIIVARNGLEAIELAEAHRPDVILMDIQMPGMDGLESTRRLRQNPNLTGVPIIALTALAMPEDRERCLQAGVDDYLSKPVKLSHLVAKIQHYLSKQENAHAPADHPRG